MKPRTLAIIGAGIGGLAAGCYAQRNGFDTHIYEAHALPGGLCTSWRRSGYVFDGCIHHLAGCHPASPLYGLWTDLGAMPRKTLFPSSLTQVEDQDGHTFSVYTDPDQLESHMLDLSPGDRRMIRKYTQSIRSLRRHDLLALAVTGRAGMASTLAALPTLLRWGNLTMRTAATRFRNPFLRRAFATIQYGAPDLPIPIHLNMMAQCSIHNYGFPAGGSLAFAQSIEKHFIDLGGRSHYGVPVSRVLVRNGRATGLELEDGSRIESSAVISNAFAPTTLFRLLGAEYVDRKTRSLYAKASDEMVMGIHVSLGVDRDLSQEPSSLILFHDRPIRLADRVLDYLPVEVFGFDPSLAPAGRGVIKVLLDTSYARWAALRDDAGQYVEEKERLAEDVIALLEPRFPGLKDQIEAIDVATPITTERFTGNGQPHGPESGAPQFLTALLARPSVLPGLRGFALVGQSAGGGGLSGCAAMGRNAVRVLCRQAGVGFRTQ